MTKPIVTNTAGNPIEKFWFRLQNPDRKITKFESYSFRYICTYIRHINVQDALQGSRKYFERLVLGISFIQSSVPIS